MKKRSISNEYSHSARLELIKSYCKHGIRFFCDGTPNYSVVPRSVEAIPPCALLGNGCPVKYRYDEVRDDKER